MQLFQSAEEILDFAIENEEKAQQFYLEMSEKVKNPGMAQAFKDFAAEESRHRTQLQRVKDGRKALLAAAEMPDLKISDYLVEVEPSPDMDYQDALALAMQNEKAAFKLYQNLAQVTDDPELQELFMALAQEEAKHKLRLELEYDEHILGEN